MMQVTDILDLELKNELDILVFRDCPEQSTTDLIDVNYGPTKDDKVVRLHRKARK